MMLQLSADASRDMTLLSSGMSLLFEEKRRYKHGSFNQSSLHSTQFGIGVIMNKYGETIGLL